MKTKGRRGELLAYASAKPGAFEDQPWDDGQVYKVGGKIFAFFGTAARQPNSITVSSGAEAAEWRARYPESISVAPYLGRHGWNVVLVDADVPLDELHELIDSSYDRVVAGLPKRLRP